MLLSGGGDAAVAANPGAPPSRGTRATPAGDDHDDDGPAVLSSLRARVAQLERELRESRASSRREMIHSTGAATDAERAGADAAATGGEKEEEEEKAEEEDEVAVVEVQPPPQQSQRGSSARSTRPPPVEIPQGEPDDARGREAEAAAAPQGGDDGDAVRVGSPAMGKDGDGKGPPPAPPPAALLLPTQKIPPPPPPPPLSATVRQKRPRTGGADAAAAAFTDGFKVRDRSA